MAEEMKTDGPDLKVRYSDEELQEFKAIILDMLEKAKKEYKTLRDVVTHGSSNDIEDTSPTFKVMEEGASTLSKEEAGALAQRQYKFIQNLEAALVRIENKTYGVCRVTGKLMEQRIDEAYLQQWEARLKNSAVQQHGETAAGCDSEKKARGETADTSEGRIADFRVRIAQRQKAEGKAYLSFYYLQAENYEIR